MWKRFLFVLTGLTLGYSAVLADEPLTNADIETMVGAGLSDDLVVAKINQADEVEFVLEVEDLVALKEAGVSDEVTTAMLERMTAPSAEEISAAGRAPGMTADGVSHQDLGLNVIRVSLASPEGIVPLQIMRGEMSSAGFGMWRLLFMDYPGLNARVRTGDSNPTLLVESTTPLTGGRYFLVKLDSDDDDGIRSLKVSSAKGRLKSMFGNSRGFMEPDHDWVIGFSAAEEQPNLWRVTPDVVLEPGEYGWYVDIGTGAQQTGLYGFGVD